MTWSIIGIQESWKNNHGKSKYCLISENYVSSRTTELYAGLLLAGLVSRLFFKLKPKILYEKKIRRLRIIAVLEEKSVDTWLFFLNIYLVKDPWLVFCWLNVSFFFFSKAHRSPESFIDLSLCRSRKKQWNLMVENETFEQNVKCIFECISYRMGVF